MTRGYGIYCSAINCRNSRGKNPDRSFFRFPREPSRSKQWVINSGREDLQKKSVEYLCKNCCICSDHFETHQFLNDLKNRLHSHAIPTIFTVPTNPPKLSASRRRLKRIRCRTQSPDGITECSEIINTQAIPLDHSYSRAVIKQKKAKNGLNCEAHTSITMFPVTVHSPMLIKKESSTVRVNYDVCQVKREPEGENQQSWEEEMSVNDPLGTETMQETSNGDTMDHHLKESDEKDPMLNYTCQVKQEPQSENEQSWEEGISIDDPLGTIIKQENTRGDAIDHHLQEDEINHVFETVIDVNEGISYTTIIEVGEQQHSLGSYDECHSCRFCRRNFKTVDLLNKHMMSHPNDYACTYACDYCEKAFKSKDVLNKHKASQQSKKNLFSCDICGRTFVSFCQFKSHEETCRHSKERRYRCDVCRKAFKLKGNLREHKEFHSDKMPYACDFCEKTFKIKRRLQRHIATSHSSVKPFSCDVCGKAFKWASLLNNHKAYGHSNEKPYSCDVCGKAFKQQGYLNRHVIIHSDERPYSCVECGKGFKQHSALDLHKASVHLNERPHSCDVCGKAYKQRSSLKQHQASMHLNGAPYIYGVCGKAFKNRRAQDKHVAMAHQEKKNVCDVCGKRFKLRSYLIRHKEIHKG